MTNQKPHNEMDCKDIGAILSGLVDDELGTDVRHDAERHIASCESCAAALNEAEQLDSWIVASVDEADALPAGFEDAVFAETTRAGLIRPSHRWFGVTGWLAAAASLALAATVWMQGGQQNAPGGDRIAGDMVNDRSTVDDKQLVEQGARGAQTDVFTHRAAHYQLGPEVVSAVSDGYVVPGPNEIVVGNGDTGAGSNDVARQATGSRALALGLEHARSSAVVLDRPMFFSGRPRLPQQDEDTLFALAETLEEFEKFDGESMKVVDDVRRRIIGENLIDRVQQARERLTAEHQSVMMSAEAILWRIETGPIDQTDVASFKQIMKSLDLIARLDRISGRVDMNRAM